MQEDGKSSVSGEAISPSPRQIVAVLPGGSLETHPSVITYSGPVNRAAIIGRRIFQSDHLFHTGDDGSFIPHLDAFLESRAGEGLSVDVLWTDGMKEGKQVARLRNAESTAKGEDQSVAFWACVLVKSLLNAPFVRDVIHSPKDTNLLHAEACCEAFLEITPNDSQRKKKAETAAILYCEFFRTYGEMRRAT